MKNHIKISLENLLENKEEVILKELLEKTSLKNK